MALRQALFFIGPEIDATETEQVQTSLPKAFFNLSPSFPNISPTTNTKSKQGKVYRGDRAGWKLC
jgi:hypothetical protein